MAIPATTARASQSSSHSIAGLRLHVAVLSAGLLLALLLAGCGSSKHATQPTLPTATATPAMAGQMTFGSGYVKNADGSLSIVGQTTTFAAGAPFTFLVTLHSSINSNGMGMRLYDMGANGKWAKLTSWLVSADDPNWGQFTESYTSIGKIMSTCSGSQYELQMISGATVVAQGTFTYTGCANG